MTKLTFDDALQRIADERCVARDDVQARALRRRVWIAEWHIPGCVSESFSVVTTKRDAIECALAMADGPPRGMATALRRYGRFDSQSPMFGRCINTIERRTLGDLL